MNFVNNLSFRKRFLIFLLFFVSLVALIISIIYFFLVTIDYKKQIQKNAEEFQLDCFLVYAVVRVESNFKSDAQSSAGAIGIMQLMPATAIFIEKSMGEELDIFDTHDNIRMGCWYLHYLSMKFSTTTEILAAYNAGEGVVRKWLQIDEYTNTDGTLKEIPYSETKNYINRVKNFYNCYKFFYN